MWSSGVVSHAFTHAAAGGDPYIRVMVASGDLLHMSAAAKDTAGAAAMVKVKEIVLPNNVSGQLRIAYDECRVTDAGVYCTSRIYRSGVAVGTHRVTGSAICGSVTNYSEDVSGWSPGDLLQIYAGRTGASAQVTRISNLALYGISVSFANNDP